MAGRITGGHHVAWQPTCDRVARYCDYPVIKKSWLFIARALKMHPKGEAGVGTQRPTNECMEPKSMPDLMQNMGMQYA